MARDTAETAREQATADADADARLCPVCFDDPGMDARLARGAMEYAASLPEELCVDGACYRARLDICAGCGRLAKGVCVLCGCFVIVRARRANKDCPGGKWRRRAGRA